MRIRTRGTTNRNAIGTDSRRIVADRNCVVVTRDTLRAYNHHVLLATGVCATSTNADIELTEISDGITNRITNGYNLTGACNATHCCRGTLTCTCTNRDDTRLRLGRIEGG